jgi:hypothetical protein
MKKNIEIINQAIKEKKVLRFLYNDIERIVEPYVIGKTTKDKLTLLSIQTGGDSQSGTLPNWRMFELDKIKDIKTHNRKFLPYFQVYLEEEKPSTFCRANILKKAFNIDGITSKQLYNCFDNALIYIDNDNTPYWTAKDLQILLKYSQKLYKLIKNVQDICIKNNIQTKDHFKVIKEGRARAILLSVYACYLISLKADARKKEVIFARIYFSDYIANSKGLF